MGHSWKHGPAIGSDTEHGWQVPFGGAYGMIGKPSACGNCGTERMRWISRSGESHIRYRHPDGYSRHGEERMSPQEWRREYVATIFDSFDAKRKAS